MKNILYFILIAIVATSCRGIYIPHAINNFGAQSQVVLDKANFRVVRNVEVVVDFDNTNMRRTEVEQSAYGKLLQKAQLTGSQVLINVVIEEVRRAGWHHHQYVAARATIIEFLDENRNPTVSQSYRPSNAQSVNNTTTTPKEDTDKNIQTIKDLAQQRNVILEKLNTFGWQKSLLYSSYEKAFKYLIENNKIDDAKKVNRVLQDVLDNKIYKSTVEKQLKTNAEKGIPEYQTFMKF